MNQPHVPPPLRSLVLSRVNALRSGRSRRRRCCAAAGDEFRSVRRCGRGRRRRHGAGSTCVEAGRLDEPVIPHRDVEPAVDSEGHAVRRVVGAAELEIEAQALDEQPRSARPRRRRHRRGTRGMNGGWQHVEGLPVPDRRRGGLSTIRRKHAELVGLAVAVGI